MQVHCAQIVDEPENAPTLLLAHSEAELLAKLQAHSDLAFLDQDEGHVHAGLAQPEPHPHARLRPHAGAWCGVSRCNSG